MQITSQGYDRATGLNVNIIQYYVESGGRSWNITFAPAESQFTGGKRSDMRDTHSYRLFSVFYLHKVLS